MDSVFRRLYTLTVFAGRVLACLTTVLFFNTFFANQRAPVNLNGIKAHVKTVPMPENSTKHFVCYVTFGVQLDLTHCYHWNVKHIYVYMVAEYKSDEGLTEELVWDFNIDGPLFSLVKMHSVSTNTYIIYNEDFPTRGRNDDVKLTVWWQVFPVVGMVQHVEGIGEKNFDFPRNFSKGTLHAMYTTESENL